MRKKAQSIRLYSVSKSEEEKMFLDIFVGFIQIHTDNKSRELRRDFFGFLWYGESERMRRNQDKLEQYLNEKSV